MNLGNDSQCMLCVGGFLLASIALIKKKNMDETRDGQLFCLKGDIGF